MSNASRHRTVEQYEAQLRELKTNSKPMINSLTMLAEDCIRQADVIVDITEKHLRKAAPEFKLPILYLIDSIVKNVKQLYVQLFSKNIVSTFTETFEQVKKVPDKTRKELWKLRQTWNEVFTYNTLYAIDIRCHEIDPGWPVMPPPKTSGTIHVNPKFLRNLTSTSSPASVAPSIVAATSVVSSPTVSLGLTAGLPDIGLDDDMDPAIKAQLLQKQKELLELQAKKIELELLATKTQAEMMKQLKQAGEVAAKPMVVDAAAKQQQLLQQAELAKLQKDRAATLLSTASVPEPATPPPASTAPSLKPPAITVTTPAPLELLQDPRKRRIAREPRQPPQEDKRRLEVRESKPTRLSPTPVTTSTVNHPVSPIAIIPPLPLSSAVTSSPDWKSKSSEDSRKRDSRKRSRDRTPPSPKESFSSSSSSRPAPSPSRSPVKGAKSSSPTKEPSGHLDDPRKRKPRDKDHSSSSIKKDEKRDKDSRGETRRSRQSSTSSSALSPTHDSSTSASDIPSKRRKKSSEGRSSSEKERERDKSKDEKRSPKGKATSNRRGRRDSGGSGASGFSSGPRKSKEKDEDSLNARKNAVLKKSYRRTTEVSKMEDEEDHKKDKENRERRESGPPVLQPAVVDAPSVMLGDTDFRMQILHDIDLRPAGSSDQDGTSSDQPPIKKARNGNLIDDLFGREDVDLRQQQLLQQQAAVSGGTLPTTTTWAQVKKPLGEHMGKRLLLDGGRKDEEIQDILQNHPHPPPAISPATSIDSSRGGGGGCDPLGRPLLYNRLPDDPAERKRSLDSRTSIDPVERFRNEFIEQPSMATGNLSNADLQKAVMNAKQRLDIGYFTKDQFATVWRQLMQINEVNKIRDFELQQQMQPDRPAPNPWGAAADQWGQFGGGAAAGAADFGGPFGAENPWGTPSMTWGQEQPRGPNPFEEAASIQRGMAPVPDDAVPPVLPIELEKVKRDSSGTIPIDKVLRQVRFYGETAIVLQGPQGDEPREISFQRGTPKNVFIDKEREPVRCFIGKPQMIYLDRQKHTLKLGAPTRELYIDGDHYEACFGGPPVRVKVGRYFHSFKLEGPPPNVELGKAIRYDLLAGRVNLFIDGNAVGVYLDDKPQLLDFCGFPVILRFVDGFHTVLLNNRPFPVQFGGAPMRVTLPNGRKQYLRFTGLTGKTRKAIEQFVKARDTDSGPYEGHHGGSFRGGRQRRRGNRGGQFGNAPPGAYGEMGGRMGGMPPGPDAFHPGMAHESNPLDMFASIVPPDVLNVSGDHVENSYESLEGVVPEEGPVKAEPAEVTTPAGPMDVQDLLSKLMMAGLLPAAERGAKEEVKAEGGEAVKEEKKKEEEKKKKVIPPLETVDVPWDKLKERRDKLIAQITTGIQCGSCGLRFAPDQNVRYSQHLDWHFRQNRREKANARKALSRKWYYDLSDWIQFAEIEDLEERAQSLFEVQEAEMEHDARSPGTVLNPDLYTVPSAAHEGAICPQCNEGFESFYDEDKEEWRLRDAFLAESDELGVMKLYHPICHQDFMAAAQGLSTIMEPEPRPEEKAEEAQGGPPPVPEDLKTESESEKVPETVPMDEAQTKESASGGPAAQVEEDEEVLIIKEGKPEPVIMEIVDDEEECSSAVVDNNAPPVIETQTIIVEQSEDASLSDAQVAVVAKDSDNQNSETVCIDDDDQVNNADNNVVEFNNKTDDKEVITNDDDDDSSSIQQQHTTTVIDTVSSGEPKTPSSVSSSSSSSSASTVVSPASSPPSPPEEDDEDKEEEAGEAAPEPAVSTEADIFDMILGASNQSPPEIQQVDERPYKPIIYQSMKFDVPTPIIKDEPVEPEETPELDGTLECEMRANLDDSGVSSQPIPGSQEPSQAIDIDLTGEEEEEDTMEGLRSLQSAVHAIEGNIILSAEAPAPLPKATQATRIKIRIMDAVLNSDSQSPKHSPARVDGSPRPPGESESAAAIGTTEESSETCAGGESEILINDSQLARLKPRLAAATLRSYPKRETGQEVSGLCTIC